MITRIKLWWRRRYLKTRHHEQPSCSKCHEMLAEWEDPCLACEKDKTESIMAGLDPDDVLPIGGGESVPTWEIPNRSELPDEDLSGLFSGMQSRDD